MDTGSRVTLTRAIETAQRANTLVYSILYADPEAYGHQGGYHGGMGGGGMGRPGGWGGQGVAMGRGPGGGGYPQQPSHPDGKKVLQQISRETGGRFFEVSKKEPISQIYTQIEEELRNQYNLGYSPIKPSPALWLSQDQSDHHQQRPHRADHERVLRGRIERDAVAARNNGRVFSACTPTAVTRPSEGRFSFRSS